MQSQKEAAKISKEIPKIESKVLAEMDKTIGEVCSALFLPLGCRIPFALQSALVTKTPHPTHYMRQIISNSSKSKAFSLRRSESTG